MTSAATPPIRAVLLDLDGTLVDTLPDLHAALNGALREAGLAPVAAEALRPLVSRGAAAMLDWALAGRLDDAARDMLLERFLACYARGIADRSRPMPGMAQLLEELEAQGMPWGIVTNKLARFTGPLLRALGLEARAACVVSGDTARRAKPYPDPLLYACERLSVAPANVVYVGDARADVEAGRRAGMRTAVATFGFLAPDDDPAAWAADLLVDDARELLAWIRRVNGARAGHA